MTNAPIQIRNPAATSKIRELAALKGRPITEVVESAVAAELDRARRDLTLEERRQRVRATVARYAALPKVGPMLTDADLYDEDGFPR